MKKTLLGTIGLLALGWRLPPRLLIWPLVLIPRHHPRSWLRSTTGAASTSVPTVVGVRATNAGMTRTSFSLDPPPLAKVVTMRPAERLAVRSDIAGRPAIGCSVWRRRATGLNLNGSNVSVFVPRWTNNSKIEAFGLFTGQVGYAWNNVLWYVKGGAAVTDDAYRGTVSPTFPLAGTVFDDVRETRWGGVVGTGIEFGFAPNWSVAFEYDHLFMGNREVSFISRGVFGLPGIAPGAVFRTDRIGQDVDLVTARINYRFGGPLIAKY